MDKTVEAFDREKSQIHKTQRGKLKIQMVIYWSVRVAFVVNKYY